MPRVKMDVFWKHEIPLPPLEDQKRIAQILSQVEGLIAQRKQNLQHLDDLLKSVFLDMFGDPIHNEKGWEPLSSDNYSSGINVGVVIKPASYYQERGVIALRSLNIKPNFIDLKNIVYFSKEDSERKLSKSILNTNDVLIVRTGNTGTAAVVTSELNGANCIDLIQVRPNPEVLNPHFFSHLLNSERTSKLVKSKQVGGIHKHFNVKALKSITFPIPPLALQNQFAAIVEKVEGIKDLYQLSLTEFENLYGTLSQKAFKGDLDLSRIILPEQLKVHEQQSSSETPLEPTMSKKPEPFVLTEDSLVSIISQQSQAVDIPTLMSELDDRLSAHRSEDDETDLPSAPYDDVSKLIIKLLEKKTLTQTFDDEENQIRVSVSAS